MRVSYEVEGKKTAKLDQIVFVSALESHISASSSRTHSFLPKPHSLTVESRRASKLSCPLFGRKEGKRAPLSRCAQTYLSMLPCICSSSCFWGRLRPRSGVAGALALAGHQTTLVHSACQYLYQYLLISTKHSALQHSVLKHSILSSAVPISLTTDVMEILPSPTFSVLKRFTVLNNSHSCHCFLYEVPSLDTTCGCNLGRCFKDCQSSWKG